jgi:hypothetical protein
MNKRIFLDTFFYLAVPLLMWNLFREDLGDYHTILYGMLPAVIYTIALAIIQKEWNVTGVFFLSLISLNFVFNLISKTAEQELWNGVYMSGISFAFYLLTILIKKPIGMYFFIDYAYAKGVPRKESKALYSSSENSHHFVKFTLFLILREIVVGVVKSFLIFYKGVDAFNTIQVTSSVLGYVFTGLTVAYVIYIIKKIKQLN